MRVSLCALLFSLVCSSRVSDFRDKIQSGSCRYNRATRDAPQSCRHSTLPHACPTRYLEVLLRSVWPTNPSCLLLAARAGTSPHPPLAVAPLCSLANAMMMLRGRSEKQDHALFFPTCKTNVAVNLLANCTVRLVGFSTYGAWVCFPPLFVPTVSRAPRGLLTTQPAAYTNLPRNARSRLHMYDLVPFLLRHRLLAALHPPNGDEAVVHLR